MIKSNRFTYFFTAFAEYCFKNLSAKEVWKRNDTWLQMLLMHSMAHIISYLLS